MWRGLLLIFALVLAACSGEEHSQNGPLLLKIDPRDHKRFDQIRNEPNLTARQREQILFLQRHGHDLAWYPNTYGEIVSHETVQIVFFNYTTYTLGFCSGMLVSGNFILTSGHCAARNPELRMDRALCDGFVLFAAKPTKNGPLEYYRCDRVVSYSDSRNAYTAPGGMERWVLDDHILFRLNNRAGTPPVNRFVREAVGRADHVTPSSHTMGLVVDPPANARVSLRSQYEVVVSEVVDGHALAAASPVYPRADALHIEASPRRTYRAGNSGSPVYLLDAAPVVRPLGVFTGNRTYLGPFSSVAKMDEKYGLVPLLSSFLPSVSLWVRP